MIWPVVLVLTGCSGASPTAPSAPTFQLTGRILDANTRLAIPAVTLSAVDGPNAGKTATSTPDGRYELGTLQSGSFRMRARRDGYEDHIQEIAVTSHTNIDFMMIPGRSVGSGWSGGSFYAMVDGAQTGARVTDTEVTQSGTSLNGQFTTADGTTGTFSGQLAGTQFTGTMRVEIVTPARRCRGTAGSAAGTVTSGSISLNASSLALDTCSGSVTNVVLTLTP